MPKVKTPCERDGHAYSQLREYRETLGNDTILFSVLLCSKCADVQTKETGLWKGFVAQPGFKKKQE